MKIIMYSLVEQSFTFRVNSQDNEKEYLKDICFVIKITTKMKYD